MSPSTHSSSLDDRACLVTGGGTGIGRAIARSLARSGARVAIAGRRFDVLEATANEPLVGAGELVPVVGDIASAEGARSLIASTLARLGQLDILVNNAGVARGGPLDAMSDEDLDLVIDVDLKGPIYMIRAAMPALRQTGRARGASILNISSSVTLGPVRDFSVYSAAKAGVDALTRCLAIELAADGIRVNSICPGVVDTPILATMMDSERVARALDHFAAVTPLGRVGLPEDVAAMALHLLSPAGEFVTGAVIPVDGGLSLGSEGKSGRGQGE